MTVNPSSKSSTKATRQPAPMSAPSKVVKMGDKLANVSENAIVIREPGKLTIKVFPKRQEYSETPAEKRDDLSKPPEELTNPRNVAKRDDVVFKSAGVEKVGGIYLRKD